MPGSGPVPAHGLCQGRPLPAAPVLAAWGTCFHGKPRRAALRSGSLGETTREMFARSSEAVSQKTHKQGSHPALPERGEHLPAERTSGRLSPMLSARSCILQTAERLVVPAPPHLALCCPPSRLLSHTLGRHKEQPVPAPASPLLCVTESGCVPAALLLQRGTRGSTRGPAVSARMLMPCVGS